MKEFLRHLQRFLQFYIISPKTCSTVATRFLLAFTGFIASSSVDILRTIGKKASIPYSLQTEASFSSFQTFLYFNRPLHRTSVCVIIISRVAYHIITTKKHLTLCHRWLTLFVVNELRKLEKPVTRAAPAGVVLLFMQKILEVFYG